MTENTVKDINTEKLFKGDGGRAVSLKNPASLLGNVEVSLSVSVGDLQLPLNQLLSLKENDILNLDTDLSSPISLMVDKQIVAQGKLVMVDQKLGVQITKLAEIEAE